jgi:DNA-binding GntR family transcriptional regulator
VSPEASAGVLGERARGASRLRTVGWRQRARRVLADEVADTIREAIFSGRIDLGQRLIEEDLATMLKVSRGPVREPSHS